MSDKARDLKLNIISDAKKFDLDAPAEQLDGLADTAQSTAQKMDGAFDKIARASTSSAGKVKQDSAHAGKAISEVGDEARDTSREMAASFSGSFDDIADGAQELLANAGGAFGKLGGIIGAAAAMGIGALVSGWQDAADAANEAKTRAGEVALEILRAGGAIDRSQIVDKVQEWSVKIRDAKSWFEFWQNSAVSNLDMVRDAAAKFGLDLGQALRAFSGSDSAAALEMLDTLARKEQALRDAAQESGVYSAQADELRGLAVELRRTSDAAGEAENTARLLADATRDQTDAIEAETVARQAAAESAAEARVRFDSLAEEITSSTSVAAVFDEAMQKVQEAASGTGKAVEVTTGDLRREWQRQREEVTAHGAALAELTRWGLDEAFVAQFREATPQARSAAAALVRGGLEEARAAQADFYAAGRAAADVYLGGIASSARVGAGGSIATKVADELSKHDPELRRAGYASGMAAAAGLQAGVNAVGATLRVTADTSPAAAELRRLQERFDHMSMKIEVKHPYL